VISIRNSDLINRDKVYVLKIPVQQDPEYYKRPAEYKTMNLFQLIAAHSSQLKSLRIVHDALIPAEKRKTNVPNQLTLIKSPSGYRFTPDSIEAGSKAYLERAVIDYISPRIQKTFTEFAHLDAACDKGGRANSCQYQVLELVKSITLGGKDVPIEEIDALAFFKSGVTEKKLATQHSLLQKLHLIFLGSCIEGPVAAGFSFDSAFSSKSLSPIL